jgi:hypothetical protein
VVPVSSFQTSINAFQLLHAAGIFAGGVAFILVGNFVRAGTRRPAVIAIVLAALACTYLVTVAVIEVRHGNFAVFGMPLTCIAALLAALLVSIRWLIQAAIIAPQLAAARRRPDSAAPPARPTP